MDAGDIDCEGGNEVITGQGRQMTDRIDDAGIVDKDIEPSGLITDAFDGCIRLVLRGDVQIDQTSFPRQVLHGVPAKTMDPGEHSCTVLHQYAHKFGSNATPSTRHQNGLPRQVRNGNWV